MRNVYVLFRDWKLLCLVVVFVALTAEGAMGHRLSIYPGDEVVFMEIEDGIPAYDKSWSTTVVFRFPSGAKAKVVEVGEKKRWVLVGDEKGNEAWVMKKYIAKVIPGPTPQADSAP